MFDIGIQELIVIFVIVLVVFGPEKLPEIARVFGRGIGDLQRTLRSAKDELDTEVSKVKDEIKDELKDPIALKNELFTSNDLFDVDKPKPAYTAEPIPDESVPQDEAAPAKRPSVHDLYQESHAGLTEKQRVLQQLNKSLRGDRNV